MSLKKLTETHKLCARLQATTAVTLHELADMAGLSYNHMSRVINDPLFIAEVNRIRDKAETKILTKRENALNKLYGELGNFMDELIFIAKDRDGTPAGVRAKAIVDAMSYCIRKKGEDKEKEYETPYLGVMQENLDDLRDDPDVMPNPENIVKFQEAVNG